MIELTYAIVFCICVLLAILIKSKHHIVIKFFAVVLSITVFTSVFLAIQDLSSLPINGAPTGKIQILGVAIVEPSSSSKGSGIWLWARKLNDEHIKTYKFAYNKKLHEKLNEIDQKLKKGQSIYIDTNNLSENENSLDQDQDSLLSKAKNKMQKFINRFSHQIDTNQSWEYKIIVPNSNLPSK